MCHLFYFGKTVQQLRNRVSGHRSYMKRSDNISPDELSDENCLAVHASTAYSIRALKDSIVVYKFSVVEFVSNPGELCIKEQGYVNSYRTFKPFGLNLASPVGLKPSLVS